MRDVTIIFPMAENKIFLGRKKRGFGAGKVNGFGGKFRKEDITVEKTALREFFEETGASGEEGQLVKVAEIEFYFPEKKSDWNQKAHVYFLYRWEGEMRESEEMTIEAYSLDRIPYSEMWDTDQHWLPPLISRKKVKGVFYFNDDCSTTKTYQLDSAVSF